jgi:hypothetical protein
MIGALEPYRVKVERRLSRGTKPGTDGRTRCYDICAGYVVEHRWTVPSLCLVHGDLSIVGNLYAHSWIEFPSEECVFEPIDQCFYKLSEYYRRLQPTVKARYTADEAIAWMRETNHVGPWHDERLT